MAFLLDLAWRKWFQLSVGSKSLWHNDEKFKIRNVFASMKDEDIRDIILICDAFSFHSLLNKLEHVMKENPSFNENRSMKR